MQDINVMPFNLKAEIIANLLYDRGVSSENVMIHFNSAFNRPFRRDVEKVQLGIDEERDQLTLFLSRNGIYDLLPEGLIHERNEGSGRDDIQRLIHLHQKQKREEKEARKFFKPFENELFGMSVRIEQQEVALLKNQDHQFQNFLVRFWDINSGLSESQKQFLLKIAPLAYSLKGNIAKICKVLQVFLGKTVKHNRKLICIKSENREQERGIILGRNFIAGNATEELPMIQFQIEGVEEDEIVDYLKGGSIYKFIEEFLEYLLPVEYELEINCKTDKESLPNGFGVLGYSAVLNS
ncbi:hypothetical protein [Ancylomarina sp. 16SWW S1-10-2]|uniref:hypothetical protein n=1 Tax=Ancylomarina sp. 16SWW S1-10-2 TaxID=2499681 RepID=UPI0012AD2096|nr:hypothetical protein [Ancylomarina sp. 16SWW S1-10-2]MRT94771.1 hypothetical protein [Ancylomarina sp. 16SWW S1-10-2]